MLRHFRRPWTAFLAAVLLWSATIGALPVAAAGTYASTILGDGPVSYWRLGEQSGTTAADSAGTNPGSIKGGVTLGVPGALPADPDTAMRFDGSSGYVSVNDASSLDFTGDFSVEAWAQPRAATTVDRAIVHKGTANSKGWQYRLGLTSGNRWRGSVFVGSTAYTVTASVVPSTTAWTYLVLTRAANQLTLYVNGAVAASTTFSGTVNRSTGILAIGRSGGANSSYFSGAIDEVAVYPTALTSTQVAGHYQTGTYVPPAPVAAFTAAPASGTAPLAVAFTDTSTGGPTAWSWAFGDGTGSTAQSPSHAYTAAGTYTVTLTASNAGGSSTATGTVAVAAPPGYQDMGYSGVVNPPTSDKPQSKLWWNDGSWWADMWDSVSGTWHIFRLDRTTESWVDTGTRIDARSDTLADVLWDGAHLYVASHVVTISSDSSTNPSVSNSPAYLYRYSYANGTYTIDAGFPATITTWSSESMTIDKDSTGTLWATWTQVSGSGSSATNAVYVNSTVGSDATWGTPFVLPVSGANPAPDDISAVVAYGGNKIGVMWSNQLDGSMYWAVHVDGTAATQWRGSTALQGKDQADDHINLKSLQSDSQGRVYAAVKTSADLLGSSTGVLIDLLVFKPATGAWNVYAYGTVADCHTRPIVVLDSEHGIVHMFATAPVSGCPYTGYPGYIYEKTAPMDSPVFPSGRGTPVIVDSASPNLNDATSTKQGVTSTTGLVVLASNESTHRYWHLDESLGSVAAPVAAFTAAPASGTAPLAVAFTDTSTGGPTAWSWAFGDGTGSTAQSPSHAYTAAGTYTVTLTASNAGGSSTATGTVAVSPGSGPVYAPTVLSDGPAAYWRLGELSGTTAADSASTNTGTYTGGFTLGVPGAIVGDSNTAVGFDAKTGYVSVPDASSLDPTGDFTVEAWAKPNALTGIGGAVVHKGGSSGYSVWQYRLSITSANQWRGTVFVGNSAITVTAAAAPSTTSWTYLVMTKAGTTLTLYVNGVAVATTTVSGTVNTSKGILAIGRTGSSSSDYFNGQIDEVAVYDSALSASRVQAHYAAGMGSN